MAEGPSKFNRIGLRAVSRHWPNGEVPYILEDDFDDDFRVRQLIMIVAPVSVEMFKFIRSLSQSRLNQNYYFQTIIAAAFTDVQEKSCVRCNMYFALTI